MTSWLAILAVGAGSYLMRVGPLLAFRRVQPSERFDRLIRHAGTAAVAALVASGTRHGAVGDAAAPTLAAVATGVVLAARGFSMLRLLLAGVAVYVAVEITTRVVS